jgi:hypothetical protein
VSRGRRGLLLVVVAALPLLVGSVRPKHGGTVQLSLPATATGVEPVALDGVAEGMLAGLVFDGLYAWEPPGEAPSMGMRETQALLAPGAPHPPPPATDAPRLVPRLASRDPVAGPDGKSFRIPLRPGVRCHDGRVLRAADVAESLARTLRTPGARWLLAEVDGAAAHGRASSGLPPGIVVVSDSEIELRFATAPGDVRRLLAAAAAAIVAPASRRDRPVGTGPFRAEGVGASGATLRAHAAHFAGPPFLERVLVTAPRARNDEVRAFEVGQLSMSFHAPSVYGGTPRGGSRRHGAAAVHLVALLPNASSLLLGDPDARRAIALAVDRARLTRLSMTPVGILPARPLARDLGAARAAISRAAARLGVGVMHPRPHVSLSHDEGDVIAASVAEVVVASLDEIGVDVRLVRRAGAAQADLRLAILLPAAPDPPGIVAALLGASGETGRAAALLARGDLRAAEREGVLLHERGTAIVLGLRAPALHARATLLGLRFDPLGRLDLSWAWVP